MRISVGDKFRIIDVDDSHFGIEAIAKQVNATKNGGIVIGAQLSDGYQMFWESQVRSLEHCREECADCTDGLICWRCTENEEIRREVKEAVFRAKKVNGRSLAEIKIEYQGFHYPVEQYHDDCMVIAREYLRMMAKQGRI